jgi:predicted Fe-Mo cluster-binding NifX family protein
MRVAVSTWSGRISPVFDEAKVLLVVDLQGGREVNRQEVNIEAPSLAARARCLAQLGADILICGAISCPLEAMLASTGIHVIPQTCGAADGVLQAFARGELTDDAFLMPGCCGRRRWFQNRHRGRHGACGGQQPDWR